MRKDSLNQLEEGNEEFIVSDLTVFFLFFFILSNFLVSIFKKTAAEVWMCTAEVGCVLTIRIDLTLVILGGS